MIKKFEALGIWKESRELCVEIHVLISSDLFSRDYALSSQMNRSSGSIMDNIAEGFGRAGNREFIQFLSISKASWYEVKSQIYRALDRNYLSQEKAAELFSKIESISNQIGGFIKYLNQSEFKGSKFKEPDLVYLPNSK